MFQEINYVAISCCYSSITSYQRQSSKYANKVAESSVTFCKDMRSSKTHEYFSQSACRVCFTHSPPSLPTIQFLNRFEPLLTKGANLLESCENIIFDTLQSVLFTRTYKVYSQNTTLCLAIDNFKFNNVYFTDFIIICVN